MISIIICSRGNKLDDVLAANIQSTVGVVHELIVIDNSDDKYGICEAYNEGVVLSKYDILCFMHDDVSYHTLNWGKKVIDHFAVETVNAIGIAGSPYCAYMPGPWWGGGLLYEHLLQGDHDQNPSLKTNGRESIIRPAVLLDGLWFCIKKDAFQTIKFDDVAFPDYHFYDMDISLQIQHTLGGIYCISDVLVKHPSLGKVDRIWVENALAFHQKWKEYLPITCLDLTKDERSKLEYKTLNSFILACSSAGYSNKYIYQLAMKCALGFAQGFWYYKTPGYLIKFALKYLFKKGKPFYGHQLISL